MMTFASVCDFEYFMKLKMKRLAEIHDILYAWELLEYHDKNYLPSNPCWRSEERQRLLNEAREITNTLFKLKEEKW